MEDILGIRTRWKISQVTFGGEGGGVGEKDKKLAVSDRQKKEARRSR
jgi:hypothetical protein